MRHIHCMRLVLVVFVASQRTLANQVELSGSNLPYLAQSLGYYEPGTQIQVSVSGDITVNQDLNWTVQPDGSLLGSPDDSSSFINPGATNYPTTYGGDGINHFLGGGSNYDPETGALGPAGDSTTDTTDPGVIRLGALIGGFGDNPSSMNWFLLGYGGTITVPADIVPPENFYVAVNNDDARWSGGAYFVSADVISQSPPDVPEPAAISILCWACWPLLMRRALGSALA